MTIEITNIQRIRVYTPEGTFATDGTGTLANYKDVPFVEGTAAVKLSRALLNPGYAQQYLYGHAESVLGIKSCELTITLLLAPTGTAGASGIAAVTSPLGRILKAVMGAEDLGTGDDVQASPAPTLSTFTVAGASANGIKAGAVIGLNRGTSSGFAMRTVESVSTNAVVVKQSYVGTPTSGDDVYGCATYSLTQNPSTTLQFLVEGAELQDRWLLLGCQLSAPPTIEIPIGELPKITFTFRGATWLHGSECTYTSTGALGIATYSSTSPVHAVGEFRMPLVSTATLSSAPLLAISGFTVAPAFSFAPVTSPSGTQTISSWRAIRPAGGVAVSGTVTLPYEEGTETATSPIGRRDAKTDVAVHFQLGSTAGSSVLIDIPTVQITDVQLTDAGGIRSQVVSFEARQDGDVGSSVTDLALSPFRIALG